MLWMKNITCHISLKKKKDGAAFKPAATAAAAPLGDSGWRNQDIGPR